MRTIKTETIATCKCAFPQEISMAEDEIPYMPRLAQADKENFCNLIRQRNMWASIWMLHECDMVLHGLPWKLQDKKPRFLMTVETLLTCINIDYTEFPGVKRQRWIPFQVHVSICLSGDPKFHGNVELNAHYSISLEFYETDFYGEINSIAVQCLFDHAWQFGNILVHP